MLQFKEFLLEYLTDEQRKNYANVKMTDKARQDTDHFFGKDNDLKREEIKGFDGDKSEVHKKLEQHLGKEIHKDDYVKGVTKDNYGRDVKIGKMVKDEKLRNEFANDNTRAGTKKSAGHYVTVVRGTEVAGQTNSAKDKNHPKGHSWGEQSCKNVDTGMNRHYLEHEIKHGSTVVRVHDHNDQEIYRATLHPHHNDEGHVTYAVDSEYGIKHPSFTAHAHDVAKRLSGEPKGGSIVYKKHDDVYDDSGQEKILHPNATKEHLDKALDDEQPRVRKAAASHPNATKEHLDKALDDEQPMVRKAAASHPNANKEHLDKAINDKKSWQVREAAASHPNATKEHLDKALDDDDLDVRIAAVNHPNVNKEHLDKALDNKQHIYVRQDAARHPNATKEHLDKALGDEDEDVREAAKENLAKRQPVEPKPVAKKPKPATPKYKNYIKFH